jgi:probable HAF family extracellular repeat protein
LEPRCLLSTYSITDLGTLGENSLGYGVNAIGHVTGGSETSQVEYVTYSYPNFKSKIKEAYYPEYAFQWTPPGNNTGGLTSLGTLRTYDGSEGRGINDTDQVAGSLLHAVGTDHGAQLGPVRAFLWQNGKMQDLGVLGGQSSSEGLGINNGGQVVGASGLQAFLWTPGGTNGDPTNPQMLDLGSGAANGINNAPSVQVVGFKNGLYGAYAFVWQNGVTQDLGTLGGLGSDAEAINDSGQVVGWAETSAGSSHAFLYSAGTMQDLGTLGGSSSGASAINASGQVVGGSTLATGVERAFLYTNGAMRDLNSLIPAGSGVILYGATAINRNGQIVCWGDVKVRNGYQTRSFLLTPATTASPAQATTASSLPTGPQATISTATAAPTVTAATFRCLPFVVAPTVTPTTSPGEWTFTFAVHRTPAPHTLFSRAEDGYGALGDPTVRTLTVD